MKNPLRKRLPRELKSEFGKYLVVFLLMTILIAAISGFLVVDNSVLTTYNESFEKYNIEDGHFDTKNPLTDEQKEEIEDLGVTLYQDYYLEEDFDNGTAIRIFQNREEVNKTGLMSGELPEAENEIALDRMYAQNNDLKVGDSVTSGEDTWKVTGLVALSDYSCLFQDNSDMMFDSVQFGVAIVSEAGFKALNEDKMTWEYAWIYKDKPADEKEESEVSSDLMKAVAKITDLEAFIPQYQNQAINFTGDDMGSDKAMMIMALYIIIAILAFVFGVTISNTITKESAVIGTLRASGYTKNELIRHYMTMPVLVTLAGALVGNILGYTVMIDFYVDLYYNSYSLMKYRTFWNSEAFWLTTVIPILIMLVVNYVILRYKLGLSPLKFLRRDLSKRKNKKAMGLSKRIPIFRRFRMRVIFQNMSSYFVMFVGMFMANVLLLWGLGLPMILDGYQSEIEKNLLANYQYMIEIPTSLAGSEGKDAVIELLRYIVGTYTENEDAEKFSAYALQTRPKNGERIDEVSLYGVQSDSKYIDADLSGDGVYISSAYADKYQLGVGDKITLGEKYEDEDYTFTVDGIYHYDAAICVFMSREKLNEMFDLGSSYFGGYFSDSKITDLDEKYVGTVIDVDGLTKVSRQLDVSMGDMMGVINVFAVLIYLVVIYLLSKVIIEKNAQSISMTKILGYNNKEISRLYILSTSIVVVICQLVSIPLAAFSIVVLFRVMIMYMMTGWITLSLSPVLFVEMFVIGLVSYAVVAALEYRKIKKIPMTDALKNVE